MFNPTIKEDGVYLKVYIYAESLKLLPENILNPTTTGADYMILGNSEEIAHVEKITGSLSDYCFDYILIYVEELK